MATTTDRIQDITRDEARQLLAEMRENSMGLSPELKEAVNGQMAKTDKPFAILKVKVLKHQRRVSANKGTRYPSTQIQYDGDKTGNCLYLDAELDSSIYAKFKPNPGPNGEDWFNTSIAQPAEVEMIVEAVKAAKEMKNPAPVEQDDVL